MPFVFFTLYAVFWLFKEYRLSMLQEQQMMKELLTSQTQYLNYQNSLQELQQKTKDQLIAFQIQMGQMQGQLHRLEAYRERLSSYAQLPSEELSNFPTGIGGPKQNVQQELPIDVSRIFVEVDNLRKDIEDEEHKMRLLESLLMNHHMNSDDLVSGRPVESGWLSSYFGLRKDPFTGLPAQHLGLDFAGKFGADIVSTGSGVVTWSGERYGYGLMVEVDHGKGLSTRYAHCESLEVNVGDVIEKGQSIAKMGSSGRSTGPHVHYEVLLHGKQVDPIKYIYIRSSKQ